MNCPKLLNSLASHETVKPARQRIVSVRDVANG